MKNLKYVLFTCFLIASQILFSQASYTTPGTYTWTVPPCVTSITVKVWGGGGGGGGAIAIVRSGDGSEACSGAGGGGGGGYTSQTYTVVPGQTYTVVVGAGGAGGGAGSGSYNSGVSTPAGTGGTGGTSSFSGNSYNLSATGGTGGTGASAWSNNLGSGACALANGSAGTGGVGSGGAVNYTGGNGANGYILYESTDKSGGGGGAAGPGGNGGNAVNPGSVGITNPPGGTGQAPGGNGGNGWVLNVPSNQNKTGNNGASYGGGGGGALIHRGTYNVGNAPGGNGANGAVLIEYSSGSAPVDPIVAITPATCSAPGSATLSNYNGSYTYTFSPSGPSVSGGAITGATPGTAYTVTANNGTCNSSSIAFTVPTQLTPPAAPSINTTAATCSAAGSSTVGNYSGSNTYTFSPAGPSVGVGGAITGATAGTSYSITASVGGCSSTSTPFTNAVQLPTPANPSVAITPATCSAPGSASISNYSGSNTYTFSPSGPSVSGGAITGATPGTAYTVTANNGTCNSSPIAFTVPTQLTPPAAPTINTTAATCSAAGSSTVGNYSGSNTYTFSPAGPSVGVGGAITGATAGISYSITASVGGCSSTSTPFTNAVQLPTPANPTVAITPATCSAPGSASISNYSGSNTYTFSPSGPSVGVGGAITGATPGTAYTVTANNGTCNSSPIAFTVPTQLTPPAAPTINTTAATCSAAGSSTVGNYSGSNTYTFSPAGPSVGVGGAITGATAGISYSITASVGGCSSTSTPFTNAVQLPTPANPTVAITPATCSAPGSASISNYSGSNTYTFSPSGPSVGVGGAITGATPGTAYTVTANNGTCNSSSIAFTVPVQIISGTSLSIQSISTTDITCNSLCNGSASASVIGGTAPYSYLWSNGESTASINALCAGVYMLNVTDANGCTASDNATITQPPALVITSTSATNTLCNGSCDGTITVNAPFATQFSSDGGTTFQTSNVLSNLCAGTYSVLVQDAMGCVASTSSTINEPLPIILDAIPENGSIICPNSSQTLSASANGGTAPFYYVWNTGDTSQFLTVNVTASTNFSCTVYDQNGCSSNVQTAVIDVFTPFTAFVSSPVSACPNNLVTLTASGSNGVPNYSYEWIHSTTHVSLGSGATFSYIPTVSEQILLVAHDQCNTYDTLLAQVNVYSLPSPLFTVSPATGCSPLTAVFDLSAATSGIVSNATWDFGDGTTGTGINGVNHVYTEVGCYDVMVSLTTNDGCSVDTTLQDVVCVNPDPIANFSWNPNPLTTVNSSVNFIDQSTNAVTYSWNLGVFGSSTQQNPIVSISEVEHGVYDICLTVVSIDGCVSEICKPMEIVEEFIIYVPNTFTPDGDEFNNVFVPVTPKGMTLDDYSFTVFDRWGEMIFESHNVEVGWDGTYHNQIVQDGTYTWVIQAKGAGDKKARRFNGHVNILR